MWGAGSVLLMCLSRAIKRVAGVRVEHKVRQRCWPV